MRPTTPRQAPASTLAGLLLALGGSATLSINDVAIKALSGDYPLHQVILIRASIGMLFLIGFVWFSGGSYRQFLTARRSDHLIRVGFVMLSNVTYFLGLAALPLADAVAIAFISPLLVTALSVLVLRETVGPRRWAAVVVGMLGVLILVRPFQEEVNPAAFLVLISAFCYASSHMMTRRMKDTESAVTLSFYVQCGFLAVSTTMGLTVGDGHLAGSSDPSVAFLLRPWVWPHLADWPVFLATGLAVAIGGLMVSQAYRMLEAALVAPFEYASMPLAVIWGVVIFGTFPDRTAWAGIALIIGAGLYTLWRETRRQKDVTGDPRGSDL